MDKDLQMESELDINEKSNFIQEFIKEISRKLKSQKFDEGTILVVDRFEGNLVVCENRSTGEMVNLEKSELPQELQESDVLIYRNKGYEIDEDKRQEIADRINDKIKNLFEDQ